MFIPLKSAGEPRALLLLLGLMLIGGTACFAPRPMTQEEAAAMRAHQEALQREQLEKLQHEAESGDPAALKRLADAYLYTMYTIPHDPAKAKGLLERAAAASYAPAQAELGWLLIDGRTSRFSMQFGEAQVPRDPARGLSLLKASAAGTSCGAYAVTNAGHPSVFYHKEIENDISDIYREGRLVPRDAGQAKLWRARSLLHCQYPGAAMLLNWNRVKIVQEQPVDLLAQLLLLPPSPQLDTLRNTLSADDVQAAQDNAAELRAAVLQSETQFPAPH